MYTREIRYKNDFFRREIEARWAVFLDSVHVRYEYRPTGILLSDGSVFHPEFWLPDFNCYFTVRSYLDCATPAGREAERKISDGHNTGAWAGLISFGEPRYMNLRIDCQETADSGGGSYDARVVFGWHPTEKRAFLISYEDWRKRTFYDSFGDDMKVIPMVTTENGTYSRDSFVTSGIRWAADRADRVWFEHGEAIEPPYGYGRR